ncbi:MAG: hypothetical protein ING18_06020 [Burkholderiales bacterium]|nr:hypothetical protein [Burkholderiales bacterium]MCA3157420.1 hypothetical protein [Burkholderiales bacterium]
MPNWIFLFVILPILVTSIFMNLESWLWRIFYTGIATYAIFGNPFPGAPIAVAVALIILLAIKKSLENAGLLK